MTRGLLAHPPTQGELERLYHELAQRGARSVGRHRRWPYAPDSLEALLALAGEMLRYDPRLLTILLQLLLERSDDVNPMALRTSMRAMRWPQALLVVLEFARAAANDPEVGYLRDYLSMGWGRVSPAERFFLDTERPGSRTAARRAARSLTAYSRWGFIGTERPAVDVFRKRAVGRYDVPTRRRILHRLVERHAEVTLAQYLDAVDHCISRQQARADLKATLQSTGPGRGARWSRR